MKYCMDCAHFRGRLRVEDREFLLQLLKSYDVKLMLESWVERGQVRIPGGRRSDPDKSKAVNILKHKGLCVKEQVHICALDAGCAFHMEKE